MNDRNYYSWWILQYSFLFKNYKIIRCLRFYYKCYDISTRHTFLSLRKISNFDKIKRSIFCRSQKTGLVLGDVWILQLIMLIEVCEKMKWTAFELCKLQGKGWNGQVQVPHLMPYQRKIRMTSIWIGSTLGLFFCGSERYPQRKKLETVHPVYYSGGEGGLIMVTGSK